MSFRTQIHTKKFGKNGFYTLQGTMSHRPLTNPSSLKITAAYCTLLRKKGGKPDRKPYFIPYGLRNPYRNLMSENSHDYAHKPKRNCTFMNLASG